MVRLKLRLEELSGIQRDELLHRSHELWKAVCGALSVLETAGAHHEAPADFAPELCSFAFPVCDGGAIFAQTLSDAHAKTWVWRDIPFDPADRTTWTQPVIRLPDKAGIYGQRKRWDE